MHLMLHIFKKDVRRVWWAIAIALLLQSCLVYIDATRADATAGTPESVLNVLLPLAWACLLALAIHEDPLVGDRQFWISRPVRWLTLLGSKLLFAAACVHVPFFLGDIAILTLRGFRAWEWIPQLLEEQAMLAAALTLPVIALAAVLPSFAQLALAGIAIAGATVYLSGFAPVLHSQLMWAAEDTRVAVFLAVLAMAAAAIIPMQFAGRRTWRSRWLGVAAAVVAELVLSCLSPVVLARVRAAVQPAPGRISFQLYPRPAMPELGSWSKQGWVGLAIPVAVSGIPRGMGSLFDLTSIDIIAPGSRYRETTIRPQNGTSTFSDIEPYYIGPDWLLLYVRRQLFDRLKDARVEIKATVVAVLHRPGETTRLPLGANLAVPGAGRCSSTPIDRRLYNGEGLTLLRVVCESPAGFSLEPMANALGWSSGAGEGLNALSSPSRTLLSPLARAQATFPLESRPISNVPSYGRLEFTPGIRKGWQVVDVDLHDIQLGNWVH